MLSRSSAAILLVVLLVIVPTFRVEVASAETDAWPYEVARPPFRFHAGFSLYRYQALFDELATLPDEVTSALRIGPPQEMVDVYLFPNRAIYEMYMRRYFPDVEARRAMFIKVSGPGNVFAYVDAGFDIDLRHECTHAILHACLPLVPLWLDEGLAEYFEVPSDQRFAHNPHYAEMQRHLVWHGAPSLKKLEAIRTLAAMGSDEYRDAWAWVHLMMHGSAEARSVLLAFMADLNHHVPPVPISGRFRSLHVDEQALFANHFSSNKSKRLFRFEPPR